MHKTQNNFKRTAILSALTVAAITGASVADAFAQVVPDNMSVSAHGAYTLASGSETGNVLGGVNAHQLAITSGQSVGVVGTNNFTGDVTGVNQYSLQMNGGSLYLGSKFVVAPAGQSNVMQHVGGANLTVDNMSMTSGATLEIYQSTLTVNAKETTVSDSTINMYSGTLNLGGLNEDGTPTATGKLTLDDSKLQAVSGVNTVNGSVEATMGSQVNVGGVTTGMLATATTASLMITGDLSLDATSTATINAGSTLEVKGSLTADLTNGTKDILLNSGGTLTAGEASLVDLTGSAYALAGAGLEVEATGEGNLLNVVLGENTSYTFAEYEALAESLWNNSGSNGDFALGFIGGNATGDITTDGSMAGAPIVLPTETVTVTGVTGSTPTIVKKISGEKIELPTTVAADAVVEFAEGGGVGSGGITNGTDQITQITLTGGTETSPFILTNTGNLIESVGLDANQSASVTGVAAFDVVTGAGDFFLGTTDASTNTIIQNITNLTGVLGADPDWTLANNYVQVTGIVTPGTATADVSTGAQVVAGRNSILVFDDGVNAANEREGYWESSVKALAGMPVTAANGLTDTGYSAVLGLAKGLVLTGTTSSLMVDGTWVSTPGAAGAAADTIQLANNSLVIVDAENFALNDVVITGAGTLNIAQPTAAGATAPTVAFDNVYLGATGTDSLILVENTTVTGGAAGMTDEEEVDSMTIRNLQYGLSTTLSYDTPNTDVVATTGVDMAYDDATQLLAGWYAAVNQGAINTALTPATSVVGAEFVNSILTPQTYTNQGYSFEAGRLQSANDLNSALRAATLSGPIASFMAVNAGADALDKRNSLVGGEGVAMVALNEGSDNWTTGMSAGSSMRNGVGLWIAPTYKSANAWGMDAGDNFETGYNASLGGIALGGDFTFENAFRIGLTFNVGAGYASSNGDLAETNNSFNYWGLGLYAGYYQENFGLTADFGYTGVYNSIDQDRLAGSGIYGGIETDTNAGAFTFGVRGEYKIALDALDITPHVGVRYTGVQTYGYDVDVNGGTAFNGDGFYQGVWTFPIGVTFSKAIETSGGWTFTPSLDLAIIPAAGDLDVEADVNIAGLAGLGSSVTTQVVDGFSYQGALGFDFGNENVTFGLDYTLTGSEHTTNHGVQATFRYEF